MRLMKSSFGHQYMVMCDWGTALYPRDESMKYQGDPSGSRLTHAEMAQKVRLERCSEGDPSREPRAGGGLPSKGPHLCQKGLPLTTGLWGAGGHHLSGESCHLPPEEWCHHP
jgi:hypothetical protein